MKKLTLISLFSVLGLGAFAHSIIKGCNSQGRAKLICSDFGHAGSSFIRVKINTPGVTWANGSQDTIFAQVDAFTIFIPQPDANTPVSVTFYNLRHDYHGSNICTHSLEDVTASTGTCLATPLVFSGPPIVKSIGNGEYTVSIVTFDSYNVSHIDVRVKIGGGEPITVTTIRDIKNGNETRVYSAKFKIN